MSYDEKTGLDFPIFQKELYDLFGEPNEKEFADYCLRTLDLKEFSADFAHVKDYTGALWKHRIYCNYVLHDPLRRTFGWLVEMGLAGELKTYDGCFNIRRMKGGGNLSVHSWGLAVDLNAAENPYGGQVMLSDGFVRCFSQAGFEWGGLWRKKDGMHFQLCWTQDWRGASNPLAPVVWVA